MPPSCVIVYTNKNPAAEEHGGATWVLWWAPGPPHISPSVALPGAPTPQRVRGDKYLLPHSRFLKRAVAEGREGGWRWTPVLGQLAVQGALPAARVPART